LPQGEILDGVTVKPGHAIGRNPIQIEGEPPPANAFADTKGSIPNYEGCSPMQNPTRIIDITAQIDRACLKAHHVAERLSISRAQAYKMMKAGELPTIPVGRSLRAPARALDRWIEEKTRKAA
jgi:excisionase family DNA binding protein